jgi:hypothetical protein
MWVSRYGDLKEDLFAALKQYIEDHQVSSLDFARQCGEECDDYVELVTVDETQLPKDSVPFIRALTRELGVKPALPLLLSSHLLLQPKDFENVAKYVLVFITRYSIIGDRNSAGMEDLLFRLAREVREMVKNSDDKLGSQQAVKHVKDLLTSNSPDDSATKKAVVETAILDVADAKYVMTRLARYIQDPQKEIIPGGETNLEHVYPQNPEPTAWGGIPNQEKLEPFTWHIGNLTIFGKKANRKAANDEFSEKIKRYALSKVKMTSDIAQNYTQWDESTIKNRATHLAKLVVQVWDFNNPSRV